MIEKGTRKVMTSEEAYDWLIGASAASDAEPFDTHVVASIWALALADCFAARVPLSRGTGLGPADISALAFSYFPGVAVELVELARGGEAALTDEEKSVCDIILMYANGQRALEAPLAAMVARRCSWPHHLWQDLGLRDRGELSGLMTRHFTRLSRRNNQDMKWKKFLYRMVCGAEGFTLCTAPVCSECEEFDICFGAEDGESRLARVLNVRPPAATKPAVP